MIVNIDDKYKYVIIVILLDNYFIINLGINAKKMNELHVILYIKSYEEKTIN